jgi:hypothetical protein
MIWVNMFFDCLPGASFLKDGKKVRFRKEEWNYRNCVGDQKGVIGLLIWEGRE